MSLSYHNLAMMPHLRSYESALTFHDNVVPIRRRDNDNRPLGARYHYFYIWKDDGTGLVVNETETTYNNQTDRNPSRSLTSYPVDARSTDYYTTKLVAEHRLPYPRGTIHVGYGCGPNEQRTPIISYLPNGIVRIHTHHIGWGSSTLGSSVNDMIAKVAGICIRNQHGRPWARCSYYHPENNMIATGDLPMDRGERVLRRRRDIDAMIHSLKNGFNTADFILPVMGGGRPLYVNPVFPTQYVLNRKAMANKLGAIKPLLAYIRGMQCLRDSKVLGFGSSEYERLGLTQKEEVHIRPARVYGTAVKTVPDRVTLRKIESEELITAAVAACTLDGDEQAEAMFKVTLMTTLWMAPYSHYHKIGDADPAEVLRMAIKHHCHREVFDTVQRTDGNVLKCENLRFITEA